ncbi:hypothetical protein ONE63_010033 [Megalurothrips usitatus]|uniref:Large ribosomal subunit protein eL14 n=1 Tax=Megalurothrips usitatus TaxID=439358 RepID=A0AAV7XI96_9NEOP|nr:hypothetical protein ONE63_010033 [Megalurothrips usitatus]KAJ1525202.1 hypothetical protein ONE63_010033 [Megalurothrips usitatus]
MGFSRFVEPGRVAYIADGPHRGKLTTIVDIIDQNRVLTDGPESGVPRMGIRLDQVHLTKFRMKFSHGTPTRLVRSFWNKHEITKKWEASSWYRRVENAKKRRAMTDFDRFKLRHHKSHRNQVRKLAFKQLYNIKKKEGAWRRKSKEELAKAKADRAAKKGKKPAAKK